MITDCNLYSQTYVLEKKGHIYKWLQLKRALHVGHLLDFIIIEIFMSRPSSDSSGPRNNIQQQGGKRCNPTTPNNAM